MLNYNQSIKFFIEPTMTTSYDVREHTDFLNLTLYLNQYQKKMRHSGNYSNIQQLQSEKESREGLLELDYTTYENVKALNKDNPYRNFQIYKNVSLIEIAPIFDDLGT